MNLWVFLDANNVYNYSVHLFLLVYYSIVAIIVYAHGSIFGSFMEWMDLKQYITGPQLQNIFMVFVHTCIYMKHTLCIFLCDIASIILC